MTTISESGLYALVLRSRKPEARKFAKWVTSEVLPAIRKTGEYRTPYVAGPNDILSAAQAEQLRVALTDKCFALPRDKQGAFMTKGWSKLKSHFGCTYRKIPQHEFTEALSLVARHGAEWELLDAPATDPLAARRAEAERRGTREIYSDDEISDRIDTRAAQLAHAMYKKFLVEMREGSQLHYFKTGDNSVEGWRPSSGAASAISSMETAGKLLMSMAENARESERSVVAALDGAERRSELAAVK